MNLSAQERDRRQGQLRKDMERAGLDVLIVYGNSGRLGPYSGNLAYVSNYFSFSGQQALVFPLEGESVLFAGAENQRTEALRSGWVADVRWDPRSSVQAELCDYMKEVFGPGKRIGISSLSLMPAAWYQRIQDQVSAKAWVEAGELIWERRLVKSEEEIALCRRAAGVADRMWDHLRGCVREGMTGFEVRMEMDRVMIPAGACDSFNMMSLGSMADEGEAPWGMVIPPTARRLRRGDAAVLEITPRVEGYWSQLARVLTIGPAAKWLADAYNVVRRARDKALKHLRPGEPIAAMVAAARGVIEEHGCHMGTYGMGELSGLDNMEYKLTEKATRTLAAGMVMVVHPMFSLGAGRKMFWGETYLVTNSGHEPLNRCSDELVSV